MIKPLSLHSKLKHHEKINMAIIECNRICNCYRGVNQYNVWKINLVD